MDRFNSWCASTLIAGLLLSMLFADGSEFNGICPICAEDGEKSTVTISGDAPSTMYCGSGHYDEDGLFHAPEPCVTTSYTGTCSNGHSFALHEGTL